MPTARILDGRALAARLRPLQAERARRVLAARGRAPHVHLIGFGERPDAAPRFVERKLRACEAAGVVASAAILGPDATTAEVLRAIEETPAHADGLFVEFPYPAGVDGDAVAAGIPPALDVDVMTAERTRRFFDGAGPPPVTVSAALRLLDDGAVELHGLSGAIVAERSPFIEMFAESLRRRGAAVSIVEPSRAASACGAQLLVVAAAHPALLNARDLASGAVVIDVGYYNENGRGDVDTRDGFAHLGAIIPVPGGIGPATIAMLIERVLEFAEGRH